jgi:RNA polymerase sigma factor (sigma-70 family)
MSPNERLDDEILVLRSQEGDLSAFEDLVDRWQPRLWRHAWRLVGDEDAAYDVLQESWLAVTRDLRRLQDAAAFHGWAYRIVTNKCRDWIRRQSRRRDLGTTLEETFLATEQETSARHEQVQNLREAMACLSGPDRAILALRYEEEFTTAEMADILEIPEGTVKSRLHHARGRLREIMKETES